VPLSSQNQVKDNWDLSVMRATSIVKILLSDAKIDPKRLVASGRGEFLPVVPNESAVNKAKNRRTEIILSPKLDELMQIIGGN
jgi:chemotaxis protein MotB